MKRKAIIGIMGPADPPKEDIDNAYELGKLIAREGFILLNGGKNCGVMEASSRGAREENGLVVGILPGETHEGLSEHVDIPIITGMGSARNNINVLSSDVVIACGMGTGTASEIALALKAGKTVILLQSTDEKAFPFFRSLAGQKVILVKTADEALISIRSTIASAY